VIPSLAKKFDLGFFRDIPTPCSLPVSGGRSSALLAALVVEANGGLPAGVIANFQNTSLELPETYGFLRRLDHELGLNLVYLEHNPMVPGNFEVVGDNSIKTEGEVFERLLSHELKRKDQTVGVRPLPNPAQRTCTANMKVKTAHRYFRSVLGWPTNYFTLLGYRWDEAGRVLRRERLQKRGNPEGGIGLFPLYAAQVIKNEVYFTWRDYMPFDLGIDSDWGNCDFCFMKSTWKIKEMMYMFPQRARRWILWEERAAKSDRAGVFRKDRPSYRQLYEEVLAGNLEGHGVPGVTDRCGTCGD